MPNALNSGGGIIQSYYGGKDDAALQQERNALAGMRQTQFDQGQQDRRKQQIREDVMGATAAVIMANPQERPALYGQIVPQLKATHPELAQVPDQYDEGQFAQFVTSSGFFPPELSQKIIAERFAPSQASVPSSVQEYEFFNKLPPDGQQQFMTLRRASRTIDLGNEQAVLKPDGQIAQRYAKAPPVQETPEYKQQQAEASARGKALGEVEEKKPALDSFGVAKTAMLDSIRKTPTGGPLGARGVMSRGTDYQTVRQFEQRMQQLSTEIRTVFRIPGEGTLTNQEQEQYGIQLPDVRNDKEINEQIMKELEARVMARMRQPMPEQPAAPQGGGVSEGQTATNPQTGERVVFRGGQWVPAQ